MKLKALFAYAVATISLLTSGIASADNYPGKPIRLVVPFAPGGTSDILAHAIGAELNKPLGQLVIIGNRPGAGGNIGSEIVAKSVGETSTLLMSDIGTHSISQSLYTTLPHDPVKDFAPVTVVASLPNILVVNGAFANKIRAPLSEVSLRMSGHIPGVYTWRDDGEELDVSRITG